MKFIQPNIFLYFFLVVVAASGFVFPVIWPEAYGFYAFIVTLSAGGLGVSSYIYYTKSQGKQLVCPTGSNCNAVITSQYSKFLGIPLEYGGVAYYSLILAAYLCLIFLPHLLSSFMLLLLSLATTVAFLFSLYLLFVQAFILRQWCIWCILSAVLSTTIFITSLFNSAYVVVFLSNFGRVIDFIHTLGFGLGIGAVSVALFLFSRYLRDSNIDVNELQTLKSTSEIIWIGMMLVLVSQFMFFVLDPVGLSQSAIFLVQTVALFVSGLSGAVLMIIFAPLLTMISFGNNDNLSPETSIDVLEKPFFITSAMALSSWYFAFVVEYFAGYQLRDLFFAYVVVLLISALLSLWWQSKIKR